MKTGPHKHLPRGVAILHEDRDVLVVEKPAGLLTMGTDTEKINTLYHALTDYVRKGNAKVRKRVFIVHRLDREVSGILIFAKSEQVKMCLQGQWAETNKKYEAVVRGTFAEKTGTITSYLAENSQFVVYSTKDKSRGKLSHTEYKVLKETKDFSLVEIHLVTGRKNQIRVHLAEVGHPVVGDKKYGPVDKEHKRLALHATAISFKHPFNGREMTLTSKVPGFFNRLLSEK